MPNSFRHPTSQVSDLQVGDLVDTNIQWDSLILVLLRSLLTTHHFSLYLS